MTLNSSLSTPKVPEAALQPVLTACPICNGQSPRAKVVTLQNNPKVDLLQCTDCGARSASRFPNEAYLKELYNPAKYQSDLLSSPRAVQRCAKRIMRFLDRSKDKPFRILDYGGSDGTLSRELDRLMSAHGYIGPREFIVVDLHAQPAQPPLRFIDLDEFNAMTIRYDAVLASAVIEHLPDLSQVVQRLLRLCAPSGIFYARTPCDAPLQRLLPTYRVRWPRHLHDLGPEFWTRFTTTFGFAGKVLHSAPSIIESDFRVHPLRTSAAFTLKLPGHIETRLLQPVLGYTVPKWDLVGGWEVVIRSP